MIFTKSDNRLQQKSISLQTLQSGQATINLLQIELEQKNTTIFTNVEAATDLFFPIGCRMGSIFHGKYWERCFGRRHGSYDAESKKKSST
jgi:hypothetical protein